MPIKWKQFGDMESPLNLPEMPTDEDWVPFVPHFRNEDPALDIYQDKSNLYIEIPLVGIKSKDVKVSIENNILTIEGKTEEKKELKEHDYLRKEIRRGSFYRSIKLPIPVKEDSAQAESIDNILKITISKIAKSTTKGKQIPIKIK